MGVVRTIALVILGISGFVFVALFGRLPAFRKTPIGFLHRVLCISIPRRLVSIDSVLFGGRLEYWCSQSGRYILHENHPLVLIFFVVILIIGQCMFIPAAWSRVSLAHRICILLLVCLPYVFLYASIATKSYITTKNHGEELERYPYDRVMFHPGRYCKTCQVLKPARSKHCSICNACVSRHDHHCVWLMNCVGLNNYGYFLSMILSLSIMLLYGSWLGHSLLTQTLDKHLPPSSLIRTTRQSWVTFFNIWAGVVAIDIRVGSVTMLMFMTAPLAMAFLVYHTYLIWAGMTTNESSKWSEWKEDVIDGFVYKASKAEIHGSSPLLGEYQRPENSWPVSSDQVLVVTDEPPKEGCLLSPDSNEITQPSDRNAPIDQRWFPVRGMGEIDNIYDLGFWKNLRHAFRTPARAKTS